MAANPSFEEHSQIAHAMKGIDFPADRDAILAAAKSNGSSAEIIRDLEQIPAHDYDNVAQVMQAVGSR